MGCGYGMVLAGIGRNRGSRKQQLGWEVERGRAGTGGGTWTDTGWGSDRR